MRDTRSVELDGAIWVLPPNQRTGCLLVGYSLGKSEEWISCTVVSQHTGNFQFLFQPLQRLQCWVCSEALTLSPAWSFHVPLVLKECVHDFPSHCWWEDRNLLLPNSRRVRSRVVITLFNSSSPCPDVTLLFGFPKHLFRLPTVLANVVTARRFLNNSSKTSQIPLDCSWLSSHSRFTMFRKLDSLQKGLEASQKHKFVVPDAWSMNLPKVMALCVHTKK